MKKQFCVVIGVLFFIPVMAAADWTLSGKIVHETEIDGIWQSDAYHTRLVFYSGAGNACGATTYRGQAWSDNDGYFGRPELPDDENVYIRISASNSSSTAYFLNEYYDGAESCEDAFPLTETTVPLESEDPNDPLSSQIFKVKLHYPTGGGTVSGRITYLGEPVENLRMQAYTSQCGGFISYGYDYTDANGNYELQHLPVGNVYIKACATCTTGHDAYGNQWWTSSPGIADECGEASPIVISEGGVYAGYDLLMGRGGSISGTLYNEDGTVFSANSIVVHAYLDDPCSGTYAEAGIVNFFNELPSGFFEIKQLPAGILYIRTDINSRPADNYVETYYDGDSGDNGTASSMYCSDALPVELTAGGSVTGINITVPVAGEIAGSVLSVDGEIVGRTALYPYLGQYPAGEWMPWGMYTRDDGSFSIGHLPVGDITLWAVTPTGFDNVWWSADGVGVPGGDDADLITIAANTTMERIDLALVFDADLDNDTDVDGHDLSLLVNSTDKPVASVIKMFADVF